VEKIYFTTSKTDPKRILIYQDFRVVGSLAFNHAKNEYIFYADRPYIAATQADIVTILEKLKQLNETKEKP